jgi:hypothetical protein
MASFVALPFSVQDRDRCFTFVDFGREYAGPHAQKYRRRKTVSEPQQRNYPVDFCVVRNYPSNDSICVMRIVEHGDHGPLFRATCSSCVVESKTPADMFRELHKRMGIARPPPHNAIEEFGLSLDTVRNLIYASPSTRSAIGLFGSDFLYFSHVLEFEVSVVKSVADPGQRRRFLQYIMSRISAAKDQVVRSVLVLQSFGNLQTSSPREVDSRSLCCSPVLLSSNTDNKENVETTRLPKDAQVAMIETPANMKPSQALSAGFFATQMIDAEQNAIIIPASDQRSASSCNMDPLPEKSKSVEAAVSRSARQLSSRVLYTGPTKVGVLRAMSWVPIAEISRSSPLITAAELFVDPKGAVVQAVFRPQRGTLAEAFMFAVIEEFGVVLCASVDGFVWDLKELTCLIMSPDERLLSGCWTADGSHLLLVSAKQLYIISVTDNSRLTATHCLSDPAGDLVSPTCIYCFNDGLENCVLIGWSSGIVLCLSVSDDWTSVADVARMDHLVGKKIVFLCNFRGSEVVVGHSEGFALWNVLQNSVAHCVVGGIDDPSILNSEIVSCKKVPEANPEKIDRIHVLVRLRLRATSDVHAVPMQHFALFAVIPGQHRVPCRGLYPLNCATGDDEQEDGSYAFDVCSKHAVIAHRRTTLLITNMMTGKNCGFLRVTTPGRFSHVSFHPSASLCLSVNEEGGVVVYGKGEPAAVSEQ